ncbi:MAG: hypothetical protein A2W35_08465 [Chloroflexi bacterium RBG_16_57_11]|nr:MAG: hypothetical protein A2W35_08465 [Chloroflexi bacterium RBG_16_57_11]
MRNRDFSKRSMAQTSIIGLTLMLHLTSCAPTAIEPLATVGPTQAAPKPQRKSRQPEVRAEY